LDKGEANQTNIEKERKFNRNKFTKFDKEKKAGNGDRKECWECGKDGRFRSKISGSVNKE